MMNTSHCRLLILIPNRGMDESTLSSRRQMLLKYAAPGTDIVTECIPGGPESIESEYEEVIAGWYILHRIATAEAEGFHGIIIYCASDPVIRAAREIVSIPVIAPGYVSLMIAQDLGNKYSILTVIDETISQNEWKLRERSMDPSRCVSVRSIGIPVVNLREDLEKTYYALAEVGRICVEQDGAHCIVLACLGMAGLGERLQDELGIPVLDPAPIAIQYAQMLCNANLYYSRKSYPIHKI